MADQTPKQQDLKALIAEKIKPRLIRPGEADGLAESIINEIQSALMGGDFIKITGVGTIKTRQSKARAGRNPKTGEKITLPERITPGMAFYDSFRKKLKGLKGKA